MNYFNCVQCSYKTIYKYNYINHLNSKRYTKGCKNNDAYKCDQCEFKTINKSIYIHHLNSKKYSRGCKKKDNYINQPLNKLIKLLESEREDINYYEYNQFSYVGKDYFCYECYNIHTKDFKCEPRETLIEMYKRRNNL